MIVQRWVSIYSVVGDSAGGRPGRFVTRNHFWAFVLAAFLPGGSADASNTFITDTELEDESHTIIAVDHDTAFDPPPNTAITSFIGGGNFRADAYVDTNAIIGVAARMSNRLDQLTSSATFSLDIENPSPFPRRMDLGFLIFPGELRLVARNAEVRLNIDVTVDGNGIIDASGSIPTFRAGGALRTNASGVTTWANLSQDNIGLPPSGPSSGTIDIPLSTPTLTAFFAPNAKGLIEYNMSVIIDATDAVAGGGFLEIAMANVSDPLRPGTSGAIQSIAFSEIPEPASVGLALLAIVAFNAMGVRVRLPS